MAQELNRRGGLSLRIFQKWKDTNIGVVVAPVLAFVMDYPMATLFLSLCRSVGFAHCALCFICAIQLCLHNLWICIGGRNITDDCRLCAQCCHIFRHFCFNLHNSTSHSYLEFSSSWLQLGPEVARDYLLLFSIID